MFVSICVYDSYFIQLLFKIIYKILFLYLKKRVVVRLIY